MSQTDHFDYCECVVMMMKMMTKKDLAARDPYVSARTYILRIVILAAACK